MTAGLSVPHAVGLCGALAILVVLAVACASGLVRGTWRRYSRLGMVLFAAAAATAALHADKPPSVVGIALRLENVTSTGFDAIWDYGETPRELIDGRTVYLESWCEGVDYVIRVAALPTSTTNYHVNAVLRGFPQDWMARDYYVTATVGNSLATVMSRGGRVVSSASVSYRLPTPSRDARMDSRDPVKALKDLVADTSRERARERIREAAAAKAKEAAAAAARAKYERRVSAFAAEREAAVAAAKAERERRKRDAARARAEREAMLAAMSPEERAEYERKRAELAERIRMRRERARSGVKGGAK